MLSGGISCCCECSLPSIHPPHFSSLFGFVIELGELCGEVADEFLWIVSYG